MGQKNAQWESIPKGNTKAVIFYTMPIKVRMTPISNSAFFEASTPIGYNLLSAGHARPLESGRIVLIKD